MKNNTRQLAFSAMLVALSLVLLLASSVLPSGRIAAVVLSGVPILMGAVILGGKYGAGIYLGSAVLGVLLLPGKAMAVAYLLLFGLYPLVQYEVERRPWQKKQLKTVVKLMAFMVMLVLLGVVAMMFFDMELAGFNDRAKPGVAVGLLCGSLVAFAIYDKGLIVVVKLLYRRMKPLLDNLMRRKGNGL